MPQVHASQRGPAGEVEGSAFLANLEEAQRGRIDYAPVEGGHGRPSGESRSIFSSQAHMARVRPR